ncbi:hypothetical protein LJR168_003761 [Pseudoxanthomonas sp. LjRoot168]|uniref:hypothetical protein n=1 Tax=unclassified Pseudoxanthomonas TaxID=2645906 RepID=UPI003ECD3A0F
MSNNPYSWTAEDNAAAAAEGWNLFTIDHASGEQLDIQREDEKEIFASDGEALMHIFKHAMDGSVLHQKALQLSLQTSPAFIPPRIGVNITGGVVQNVWADTPAQLVAVDYDVDDADPDQISEIPQGDGSVEDALVAIHEAQVLPGDLQQYVDANAAAQAALEEAEEDEPSSPRP